MNYNLIITTKKGTRTKQSNYSFGECA